MIANSALPTIDPRVPAAYPRNLFLGTYPPRQCGIATFTNDIVDAVDAASGGCSEIIAVDDSVQSSGGHGYGSRVVAILRQHERPSYLDAARFANRHPCKTLGIQHEFGIFGGRGGEWILDLLCALEKPAVVVMHTILSEPSLQHRWLVQRICAMSASVVVLSKAAWRLLIERYDIDPARATMLPHGVPDVEFEPTPPYKRACGLEDRFVVSTFGFLSRGKGLEVAIDAVAQVVKELPNVLYLILGATHPVVARSDGEAYRAGLEARIRQLGIERNVMMVNRYLNLADLLMYLAASDICVTPYVNEEQIVSGTLAYAVGAGKAVVSTPYLYARELLAGDRGAIVPFGDSTSMSEAILDLALRDDRRLAMARRAYDFGRDMTWGNVGQAYLELLRSVPYARALPLEGALQYASA
jgi:glycosyltransferase involved in cell wall biosynthesis